MVKFSKELQAQLIPEWKEAFVNYWQLKKQIKTIKLSKVPKQSHTVEGDFGRSILDSIHLLVNKFTNNFSGSHDDNFNIIKVRKKTRMGSEEEIYETELAQLFTEEDAVRVFFVKLDEELNKVNQFYKRQEDEFVERGESLNKQLQLLHDLKQIISDRRLKSDPPSKPSNTEVFSRSSTMNSIYYSAEIFGDLDETNSEVSQADEEIMTMLEKNGINFVNSATRTMKKKGKPKMAKRIDVAKTTSTREITAITSMSWEELVNNPTGDFIRKRKIQCAEKMIRSAFVELYRGLGLLKTYSTLNMVAFAKILKKFDKVSCQKVSASYLKEVKKSHFLSSDKVVRQIDEVESIFTKHFANNERKKAMKFLRPQQHKDSHMTTFLVVLAHLCGVYSPTKEPASMKIVYPVFSVFALLSLHLFMYGCNLFMWKSARINYNFIFEFSPSTALKHRDAFLICTTLMTTVVGAMVIHLLLTAAGFSPNQIDAIPGVLLLCFIVLLICPFDIFYRPTRYCFIRVIRNIVCSPFYKIPLLRYLETTSCHILAGIIKTYNPETCYSGRLYMEITYIISFLPYYWRALQCLRRWYDDSDANHLANMGKYVSAMVAAGARVTYSRIDNPLWLSIVIITSLGATTYQLYWDFIKDWGLLNPNSQNPWLRDDLILKNKGIYFASMALNVVLRVTWVLTVMRFKVGHVQSRLLEFLFASLEVIRRGHWNFYRLENEHLNNVGRFRAVKTVPLPFRDDSD
ncbi:hypothetical protein TanjilG_32138 [Lupinus angustifolius]|uniref:Uncharacterized protein n=1 Tax=Lupinus angustifolius TaxID=3871 RepID=A0A394DDV3_LUPAN|nr:hypothetical protein TanjilG_32138 [Lupinus angustifolius]